jgi:hypothetical protein
MFPRASLGSETSKSDWRNSATRAFDSASRAVLRACMVIATAKAIGISTPRVAVSTPSRWRRTNLRAR